MIIISLVIVTGSVRLVCSWFRPCLCTITALYSSYLRIMCFTSVFLLLQCPTLPYSFLSYPIVLSHILPCPNLPHSVCSYPTLPYIALPYPTLSYPTLHCSRLHCLLPYPACLPACLPSSHLPVCKLYIKRNKKKGGDEQREREDSIQQEYSMNKSIPFVSPHTPLPLFLFYIRS